MTRNIRTPGAAAAAAVETAAEVESAPDPVAVVDGMPNAIDIDVRTITAPVLTRQGWLCPDVQTKPLLR
jgi:hypothetical protein